MQKVFIIEDDRIQRITMADEIKDAGFKVVEFSEPLIALQQLKEQQVDMVFCDLKLPQIDGIEFLKRAKKINPEVSVVIMTSYATYPEAVQAIKLGAYDFITKPISTEEILLLLEKNKEYQKIANENINLRKQITEQNDFSSFIGSPENIKKIQNLIKTVADTGSTILITGETGTGKELVTKLIHYNSNRSKYSLIKVNCAILAREIFESELFGHTKGAFTGAEKEKKGRFELADGGSIYLDDIDDLPLELQVKLLRVIEEREIERVGSSEPIKIDVRLIASTKKDLKKLVSEGKFREDLFYRLNVIPIDIQPLRERKKDVHELFNYFVNKFSFNKLYKVEERVYESLRNYPWPGNIRELRNITERLVILNANEDTITTDMLPLEIVYSQSPVVYTSLGEKSLVDAVSDFEKTAIHVALAKYAGNITKASEYLGIPHSTLRSKIEKYNIQIL